MVTQQNAAMNLPRTVPNAMLVDTDKIPVEGMKSYAIIVKTDT